MQRFLLVMAVLALVVVSPCYGGTIQDSFAGTITSVQQWGSTSVTGIFHVGDSVSGVLTYNTTATNTGSSTSGNYNYNNSPADSIYGLSITTGGYTFVTDWNAPYLALQIDNDQYLPGVIFPCPPCGTGPSFLVDYALASGFRNDDLPGQPGLLYGGQIYEQILMEQMVPSSGPAPSLITSPGVSLPFSLDLTRAASPNGFIQSRSGTEGYEIDFNITGFSPTEAPEPASLPLLLGGLTIMGALRRVLHRPYSR
jgi:hypothetical protein